MLLTAAPRSPSGKYDILAQFFRTVVTGDSPSGQMGPELVAIDPRESARNGRGGELLAIQVKRELQSQAVFDLLSRQAEAFDRLRRQLDPDRLHDLILTDAASAIKDSELRATAASESARAPA